MSARWTAGDVVVAQNRMARGQVIPTPPARVRRKYGNEPTMFDGYCFDSKLEARRYGELKLLKMTGQIQDLKFHQSWFLHVAGVRVGYYESDFSYIEGGKQVIEDCKGVRTALYVWKKKHVAAEHGIEIREIKA